MLDKPIEEIMYDESGHVSGVKSQGEVARTKIVVADPSYFEDKVKKSGQVCLLQGSPEKENCTQKWTIFK